VGLIALTVISIIFREQAAAIVGVEQEWAAASILPSGAVWFLLCVERGALQGLGHYKLVAFSILGEAAARLGFGLLFYLIGLGITGAFLGTTFSIAGLAFLLAFPMAKVLREEGPGEERTFRELLAAAWAPVAAFALVAVLQNIDIVFVKHTASSSDAGSYAAASIAAKAVIWVAVGLGLYLLPEAVRRSWRGLDARPVLAQTLALVAVVAVPMVLVYAVAGEQVLSAAFGSDLTAAAGALPLLGVAMSLLACAYLAVQYLLALRRAGFVPLLGLAAVVELGVLMLVGSALVDVALVMVCLQLVLAPAVFTLVMRSAGRVAHSQDAVA
jgi:O-antigen/teichoic acid export membrane protein